MAQRNILNDKDRQLIDKRLNDLGVLYAEMDRAEKCGIDCQERRERAKFCEDFLAAVRREYFE